MLDVSPVRWDKLIRNLLPEDAAEEVLDMYACPCMDETDLRCECREGSQKKLPKLLFY